MKLVNPTEIESHGVHLNDASHTAAAIIAKIAGEDAPLMQGIMPHAVFLTNESPNRLLQVSVGYSWNGLDGRAQTVAFTHLALNHMPADQLCPGETRMFVPERRLNLHFAQKASERTPLVGLSEILARMETDFASVSELTAFVDSVTLEGIGLIGPDLSRGRAAGYDRKTVYS